MRKFKIALLCLSFLAVISLCLVGFVRNWIRNQIESPPKDIRLVENSAFVQGCWKKTADTRHTINKPSQINTVSIHCDKNSMTCKEIIAELVAPEEMFYKKGTLEAKKLFIDETDYKIVDWSDEIILAKYAAPVADFEIRIFIKAGLAIRNWRETKARGNQTADPNIYAEWILE